MTDYLRLFQQLRLSPWEPDHKREIEKKIKDLELDGNESDAKRFRVAYDKIQAEHDAKLADQEAPKAPERPETAPTPSELQAVGVPTPSEHQLVNDGSESLPEEKPKEKDDPIVGAKEPQEPVKSPKKKKAKHSPSHK